MHKNGLAVGSLPKDYILLPYECEIYYDFLMTTMDKEGGLVEIFQQPEGTQSKGCYVGDRRR